MSEINTIVANAKAIANESIARSVVNVAHKEESEALRVWRGAREVTKVAKIEIESYKLYKIDYEALLGTALVSLSNTMKNMVKDNLDSIDEGRKAFNAICAMVAQMIHECKPFEVDAEKVKIESARRSLATDIAGVEYGTLSDLVVIVHHNFYNVFNANVKLLGNTPREGAVALDRLQQNILYVLVHNGISINGKHYDAWAATSSQQKTGALYMGEHSMMERTKDARMYGVEMSEINNAGGDNGAELLKRQALLFTPSVPFMDEEGNVIRLRDCVMFNDVDIERNCPFVLNVGKDASAKAIHNQSIAMTMGDGEAYGPFSAQIRGLGIKAFCVKKDGIEDFIAAKHGINVPEAVKDYDGNMVSLSGKKVYFTKSCWKGAKLGVTWAEFVARAEKLAEKYPLVDAIRIVRYSDSTDPSKRRLTRQSVQQWLDATNEQLKKLSAYEVSRLNVQKTITGALVRFAGFELAEEKRTDANRVFEACPAILASSQMQSEMRELWNRDLCDAAAGRVRVHGSYPYIAMDPVAMLEVLVFGFAPTRRSLGVLKEGEINLPMTDDGEEVYGVRYPNNHINGQIFVNRNHDVYANIGEVAVLPYHGFAIVRFDGDFDGDEMSIITDKVVINLMKETLANINMPVIDFPHDKAKRNHISCDADYHKEIVIALWRGQKYNHVGRYSNLATKIMKAAAMATGEKRRSLLMEAVYAHVGTVLVIDMIKTGDMPEGIKQKLGELSKKFPMMPWNQRFNKSCGSEWENDDWNDKVDAESNYVCDRLARTVMTGVGEYSFDAEGVTFDVNDLLSHEAGLPNFVAKGIVDNDLLKKIRAMNYMDGDDRAVLLAVQAGKRVSPKQLMKFFFANSCSMCYRVADHSIEDRNELRAEYAKFVRNVMLNIGDGDNWSQLTEEQRHATVVNYFVRDAFEAVSGNGIDNKGSYARFIIDVFAQDILANIRRNDDTAMNFDENDLAIDC